MFHIAERAETLKFRGIAEQLRNASLSISNNISEGSGSYSNRDFANFLAISRKSVFECANIIHIFKKLNLINEIEKEVLYTELQLLSVKIHYYRIYIINNKSSH